jgi:hypothetical protein
MCYTNYAEGHRKQNTNRPSRKRENIMAKIKTFEENLLVFDDGTQITCDHVPDCCEYNYARFEDIDDIAKTTDFDTSNLAVETVENAGFRFGNQPNKMFFVPCYSSQNGYYSCNLDIYINNRQVASVDCEEV